MLIKLQFMNLIMLCWQTLHILGYQRAIWRLLRSALHNVYLVTPAVDVAMGILPCRPGS